MEVRGTSDRNKLDNADVFDVGSSRNWSIPTLTRSNVVILETLANEGTVVSRGASLIDTRRTAAV